jgi:hypothetical protein
MSIRFLSRLTAGIALLLFALGFILIVLSQIEGETADAKSPFAAAIDFLTVGAFVVVGTFLVLRRPTNVIGWTLLLPIVGAFSNAYARYTLLVNPDSGLPGGGAAAVIDLSWWIPLVYTVFLILLTFPSGRIASRRWRLIAKAAAFWVAIATVETWISVDSFDPPFEAVANPLYIESIASYAYFGVVLIPLMLAVPVAAFDAFLRFRRSRGEEREQFRWLALSGGVLVAYFPIYIALGTVADDLAYALFTVSVTALPVSIGVAILKYHLYDIDRIINRTLVYALLTAGLAGTYLGLVVGLQALLRPVSGGSDLAIVLTTLVVAALFLPARRRVQGLVDRRFNRRTYDAARTMEAFSARLRKQIDLDTLRYELLGVVDETMQPARASLWLREGIR